MFVLNGGSASEPTQNGHKVWSVTTNTIIQWQNSFKYYNRENHSGWQYSAKCKTMQLLLECAFLRDSTNT